MSITSGRPVTVDVTVPRADDILEFVLDVESDTDGAGSPYDTVVDRRYPRHTRLTPPTRP